MRCVECVRVAKARATVASAGAPCVLVSPLFTVQHSLSFPHFPSTRSVCSHSCSRVPTPKPLLLPPPPPPSLILNSKIFFHYYFFLLILIILLPLSPKSPYSSTVIFPERVFRGFFDHGFSRYCFSYFFFFEPSSWQDFIFLFPSQNCSLSASAF